MQSNAQNRLHAIYIFCRPGRWGTALTDYIDLSVISMYQILYRRDCPLACTAEH